MFSSLFDCVGTGQTKRFCISPTLRDKVLKNFEHELHDAELKLEEMPLFLMHLMV